MQEDGTKQWSVAIKAKTSEEREQDEDIIGNP